jgi:hypothetical protein
MKKSILIITLSFIGVAANAQNNAYGDNQKEVEPGVFAIYSGDVNQDGLVDVSDQGIVDNDIFNFAVGYLNSDLNGDSVVDVSDQGILDNNVFNFVGVISPAMGMRVANSSGKQELVSPEVGKN